LVEQRLGLLLFLVAQVGRLILEDLS